MHSGMIGAQGEAVEREPAKKRANSEPVTASSREQQCQTATARADKRLKREQRQPVVTTDAVNVELQEPHTTALVGCVNEGCQLVAHFGSRDEAKVERCVLHKQVSDVFVINGQCGHTDCAKYPAFGSLATGEVLFCKDHKQATDVEIEAVLSIDLQKAALRQYKQDTGELAWQPGRLCQHGRNRSVCKECGGGGICQHGRRRSVCKECGGSSICEHGRRRSVCKECGGSSICEHGRRRSRCKECGGSSICEHGRRRSVCKECGGSSICQHGRRRSRCKECRAQGGACEPAHSAAPAATKLTGPPQPQTLDNLDQIEVCQDPVAPLSFFDLFLRPSLARALSPTQPIDEVSIETHVSKQKLNGPLQQTNRLGRFAKKLQDFQNLREGTTYHDAD